MFKFEGNAEELNAMVRTLSQDRVELAREQGRREGLLEAGVPFPGHTKMQALQDLLNACGNHAKITAIKAVRELTGLGLKEAKDFVETHGYELWKQY